MATALYAFSVLPTPSVPNPPWFALVATGRIWVNGPTAASQLGIGSADVHRVAPSNPIFSQPIIGPTPSAADVGPDAPGSVEA